MRPRSLPVRPAPQRSPASDGMKASARSTRLPRSTCAGRSPLPSWPWSPTAKPARGRPSSLRASAPSINCGTRSVTHPEAISTSDVTRSAQGRAAIPAIILRSHRDAENAYRRPFCCGELTRPSLPGPGIPRRRSPPAAGWKDGARRPAPRPVAATVTHRLPWGWRHIQRALRGVRCRRDRQRRDPARRRRARRQVRRCHALGRHRVGQRVGRRLAQGDVHGELRLVVIDDRVDVIEPRVRQQAGSY